MTIKAYVLDALQKFWNRLKTSYVTDCETDDDNLALAASQGKVLKDQIDEKLGKSGDSLLTLSGGTAPRVSVQANAVSGRFVASDISSRVGLWDEKKEDWIIFRDASGRTRIGGYYIHSTAGSTVTLSKEIWKNQSGLMIINMRCTVTVAINNVSGGIYYGAVNLPDFPEAFSSKPTVTYSTEYGSNTGNAWVWGRSEPTASNPGGVYLGRGTSAVSKNYIVNVQAIGSWTPTAGT